MGAKVTVASPIPGNTMSCLRPGFSFSNGAPCTPVGVEPSGGGYQSLDLQLTKNFNIFDKADAYLRVDLLNVTNHDNLVDYQYGSTRPDGIVNTARFNPNGNITGTPFTMRVTVGAKF